MWTDTWLLLLSHVASEAQLVLPSKSAEMRSRSRHKLPTTHHTTSG
jgi:hypothetical protein